MPRRWKGAWFQSKSGAKKSRLGSGRGKMRRGVAVNPVQPPGFSQPPKPQSSSRRTQRGGRV